MEWSGPLQEMACVLVRGPHHSIAHHVCAFICFHDMHGKGRSVNDDAMRSPLPQHTVEKFGKWNRK
jgi:hypothetical protein